MPHFERGNTMEETERVSLLTLGLGQLERPELERLLAKLAGGETPLLTGQVYDSATEQS